MENAIFKRCKLPLYNYYTILKQNGMLKYYQLTIKFYRAETFITFYQKYNNPTIQVYFF